jgi:subtilisin family serine protease
MGLASAVTGSASASDTSPPSTRPYLVVSTQGSSAAALTDAIADTVAAPLIPAARAQRGQPGRATEVLAALDTALVELTPAEAAKLDAQPGLVVAPDARVRGYEPDQLSGAGAGAALNEANSWGRDRVDQRDRPLDGVYRRNVGVTGAGVHVYVFDSGLDLDHPEFAGRVGATYDYVRDGGGAEDCGWPHGTHVAGTIASSRYGVAPKATIHPVRVLDCDGFTTWSTFVTALNDIAEVAPRAAVANASLSGPRNAAADAAVANFVASGTPLVVAAGNAGDNASRYSPGSAPAATTVAASTRRDQEASFSNYGRAVDIFAPGESILSTKANDPSTGLRGDGTSMAAPHIAGWMALYLQVRPNASVQQVQDALTATATTGRISFPFGVSGSPNLLPFTGALRFPLVVRATPDAARSAVLVDVDPDVPGPGVWRVHLQRRGADGGWSTVWRGRTAGSADTVEINRGRGTYRAVVPAGQYGYPSGTSEAVFIRR